MAADNLNEDQSFGMPPKPKDSQKPLDLESSTTQSKSKPRSEFLTPLRRLFGNTSQLNNDSKPDENESKSAAAGRERDRQDPPYSQGQVRGPQSGYQPLIRRSDLDAAGRIIADQPVPDEKPREEPELPKAITPVEVSPSTAKTETVSRRDFLKGLTALSVLGLGGYGIKKGKDYWDYSADKDYYDGIERAEKNKLPGLTDEQRRPHREVVYPPQIGRKEVKNHGEELTPDHLKKIIESLTSESKYSFEERVKAMADNMVSLSDSLLAGRNGIMIDKAGVFLVPVAPNEQNLFDGASIAVPSGDKFRMTSFTVPSKHSYLSIVFAPTGLPSELVPEIKISGKPLDEGEKVKQLAVLKEGVYSNEGTVLPYPPDFTSYPSLYEGQAAIAGMYPMASGAPMLDSGGEIVGFGNTPLYNYTVKRTGGGFNRGSLTTFGNIDGQIPVGVKIDRINQPVPNDQTIRHAKKYPLNK